MSSVTIDGPTGALSIEGEKVFPLGFSEPPRPGVKTPTGKEGLKELAEAGAHFIRTGRGNWSLASIDAEVNGERALQDAAAEHGLRCWLFLGKAPNLPTTPGSANEQILTRLANEFKGHPGLGAYKGYDEPLHAEVPPGGLERARQKLRTLDADHPVVVIQAPRNTVAQLSPYRPTFDITGADIFPIAYPPGEHHQLANKDISVVGDITRKMVNAAGTKPVWTTLQIAWKGVLRNQDNPEVVPRLPTFHEERFMAYDAIIAGARGLMFFGGHLRHVMRPVDARAGWNWTFWSMVMRPLISELASNSVQPALVAPDGPGGITASTADVELRTRQDAQFLYVIAARRGGGTTRVTFSGLPPRRNGTPIAGGEVVSEYTPHPLPPPIEATQQRFRSIRVANGKFLDWFAPHDVHVYRFAR